MNHHLIKSLVHQKKFRFPFIGALWTPKGTGKFEADWFQEGRGKIYLSRGIGDSILPIFEKSTKRTKWLLMNYEPR